MLPGSSGAHERDATSVLGCSDLDVAATALGEPLYGLVDDADLIEWRVELGVIDVLVGDPYRFEDGSVDEASLGGVARK